MTAGFVVHEYVSLRAATYRVRVCGPAEAPLVILLHGFFGAADDFAATERRLCAHFRCAAVDLLGHGRSDAPTDPDRYALSETAADLAALLDHFGRAAAAVVGYSLGGRSALAFAVHFPERVQSLVLESASPGLASAADRALRRAHDGELAGRLAANGIAGEVDRWENQALFATQRDLPAEVRALQRDVRLRQRPHGLANSLRGAGTGAQISYWDKLDGLSCPSLLVTGDRDEKFSSIAQQMASLLPHCERARCADAGHNVHLERPDWHARRTLEFLLRTARRETRRV